jgi:hypothetical protein
VIGPENPTTNFRPPIFVSNGNSLGWSARAARHWFECGTSTYCEAAANDLSWRLAEHQRRKTRYTKQAGPHELIRAEEYPTRLESAASGAPPQDGDAVEKSWGNCFGPLAQLVRARS